MLLTLAKESLFSRKKTAVLTFISLTISMLVLLSVEHLRIQAKESFNRTITGADLIIGAPSGQINLLLYSVFRMGSPTNNIQYQSFEVLQKHPNISWLIPISLGDSHRGFKVLGTNEQYFEHFRYGDERKLAFAFGKGLSGELDGYFDAVVGADVAETLGYKVGDEIVVSHGIGSSSFKHHDDSPFSVVGVLQRTGTPVDKTVHVTLQGVEIMHFSPPKLKKFIEAPQSFEVEVDSITAVIVGLKNKFATFKLQRQVNNYKKDRLMAILPGVALAELWELVGTLENILRVVAALVLLAALIGLSTMLLASINERRAEIAVFRVLGAGPLKIMLLIYLEAIVLTLLSMATAFGLLWIGLVVFADSIGTVYGLFISANVFTLALAKLMGFALLAALLTAVIPSIAVYKSALHRQLMAR